MELREIEAVSANWELNINCAGSYRNEWDHLRREHKMRSENLKLGVYEMTTI